MPFKCDLECESNVNGICEEEYPCEIDLEYIEYLQKRLKSIMSDEQSNEYWLEEEDE